MFKDDQQELKTLQRKLHCKKEMKNAKENHKNSIAKIKNLQQELEDEKQKNKCLQDNQVTLHSPNFVFGDVWYL